MLTEELERLGRLHQQGIITDEEFVKSKTLLIAESDSARHLKKLTWQAELERIDREWERTEEKHKIMGRNGHRRLPISRRETRFNLIAISLAACVVVLIAIAEKLPFYFVFSFIGAVGMLIFLFRRESLYRTSYENAKTRYEDQRTEHLQQKPE